MQTGQTLIADTAIIGSNVTLGENVTVEDYCMIGCGGDLPTVIGDNAVIRSHTVIYHGNTIGDNFQTGNKANIREKNTIGDNVSIGTLSVIEHHCTIEDDVRIHTSAFIPEYSILEKGCWIGPHVVFTNAPYPLHPDAKKTLHGPHVKESAKIGANTTVLPGVTVGSQALVGAGSVVNKDVSPNKIAYGSPATEKREVDY